MNTMKPTLYLIRGVPGSGKSNLAMQLFNSGLVQNIFEADDWMYEKGLLVFKPDKLSYSHHLCQSSTVQSLTEGRSVAVSNTSTTEKEVETYRKIAEECNANFVSLIVENRHNGVNIHNVPEDKIQQMKQRFSVKL